ncbi:hypothetical protein DFH06DRAFT_661443 [Mycena polygramma]|nr:hypothetical protein DFH06DRAFT_661443 [Mycena polygramma]
MFRPLSLSLLTALYASAVANPLRRDIQAFPCPSINAIGEPLTVSGPQTTGVLNQAVWQCFYESGASCDYFIANAEIAGGTNCADTGPEGCPLMDLNNTFLTSIQTSGTSSTAISDVGITVVTCIYGSETEACKYDGTGAVQPSSSRNCLGRAKPPPHPTSNCPTTNKLNQTLTNSTSSEGIAFCAYANQESNPCIYEPDGSFASGDSSCPTSI